MATHTVRPILLALVLCDSVIREAGTNKLSLIGTFNGIFANTFPMVHHSLCVYIAITEGRGRMACKLRMTALESNAVIFELPGEIEFGGPTNVGEMVFQWNQVRFERPGVYAFEFWVGNDLLGSRKLHAQLLQQPPPK
ncbi:MAG: hypothetical protein NTW87_22565 [Planctomycetota bacterium]|nr:hypothetical protein [Planctomycetota bacterium]